MTDSAAPMEQSTLLEAIEHFVPLPASLDEELSENSASRTRLIHRERNAMDWHREAQGYGGKGPGLQPQLFCLSARAFEQVFQPLSNSIIR